VNGNESVLSGVDKDLYFHSYSSEIIGVGYFEVVYVMV
jgi:hypothetical protein